MSNVKKNIIFSIASITAFYLLGLSFASGLDKQIANECAVNPAYDYCVMFAESQNMHNDQQVLIASAK